MSNNASDDLIVSPVSHGTTGMLQLSNGVPIRIEVPVAARIKAGQHLLNASYVRSRAFSDLNDLNQFFGNLAQPVIEPDARRRLPFDAPADSCFGAIAARETDSRTGLRSAWVSVFS
jgi:hypothetical protein